MNNGIILPSLPVSILYGISMVFPPACISSFTVIKDQFFIWVNWVNTYCLKLAIIDFLHLLDIQLNSWLSPFCFSTPSWNGLSFCIPCTSYHKLDTALVHESCHHTCNGIIDLLCLVHVLHCPLLAFWWLLLCQIGLIQIYYLAQHPELSAPVSFLAILTCLHTGHLFIIIFGS